MDSIEGMKCPECGHTETFIIESGERGPDSLCTCGNQSGREDCNYSGTVEDFLDADAQTTTEPAQRTPGLWRLVSGEVWRGDIPIAKMDREPGNGTTPEERDANARHIVLAVNCHDGLLAACKNTLNAIDAFPYSKQPGALGKPNGGIARLLRAAIAKAEGKPAC